MKATAWTNGLGWDIKVKHGTAEVRDQVKRLRCFVPIAPLVEGRRIIDQHKRMDFPLGTDPVEAVKTTMANGVVFEDH